MRLVAQHSQPRFCTQIPERFQQESILSDRIVASMDSVCTSWSRWTHRQLLLNLKSNAHATHQLGIGSDHQDQSRQTMVGQSSFSI